MSDGLWSAIGWLLVIACIAHFALIAAEARATRIRITKERE